VVSFRSLAAALGAAVRAVLAGVERVRHDLVELVPVPQHLRSPRVTVAVVIDDRVSSLLLRLLGEQEVAVLDDLCDTGDTAREVGSVVRSPAAMTAMLVDTVRRSE